MLKGNLLGVETGDTRTRRRVMPLPFSTAANFNCSKQKTNSANPRKNKQA